MAEPYTSGSDILSYRGDPGLAYGGGTAQYSLNPNDLHPLAGIDSTLGRLQDHDANIRILEYKKRIEDQQAQADMLASTNGSVFNMAGPNGQNMSFTPLPEDKKILDAKAADLTKKILANPTGYKYDADILQQQRELKALTLHAGQRATYNVNSAQQAAQSNDADERNAILQTRDSEIGDHKLTDYHLPTPYLGKLSWNNETFYNSKLLTDEKAYNPYTVQTKDKDGNIIKVEGVGLNDSNFDFRAKVRPTDQKIWGEANNLANSFFNSPLSKDPNAILQLNKEADAINQARGYVDANGNPINIHAVPHIAEVLPNGTIQYNTKNPADVSYALLAKTYGSVTLKESLQKDHVETAKAAEEIKDKESEIATRAEDLKIKWANAHTEMVKAAKDDKLSKDERDQKRVEAAGLQSNVFVKQQFDNWRKSGIVVPNSLLQNIAPALMGSGFNPDQYVIKKIKSDATSKSLLAEPGTDYISKITGRLKDPSAAYLLESKTGDPKDDVLVGQFGNGAKAEFRPISTDAAVQNNIFSRTYGAKPTIDQEKTMEAAQDHYGKNDGIWTAKRGAVAEPTATPGAVLKSLGGDPEKVKTVNGKRYFKRGTKIVSEDGTEYKPNGQ